MFDYSIERDDDEENEQEGNSNLQRGDTFKKLNFGKVIRENYFDFYNHVKDFGYGMLLLPIIVKQLLGEYFINIDSATGEQDYHATQNKSTSDVPG